MKYTLIFVFLIFSSSLFAQEEKPKLNEISNLKIYVFEMDKKMFETVADSVNGPNVDSLEYEKYFLDYKGFYFRGDETPYSFRKKSYVFLTCI